MNLILKNMKKINLELIYRIIVIVLLTSILFVINEKMNLVISIIDTIQPQNENQIGRFKGLNDGSVLDTQTGKVSRYNGGSIGG